jgi:hypothetical protein
MTAPTAVPGSLYLPGDVTVAPTDPPSPGGPSGGNPGAIAGGVLGGLAAVGVGAAAVFIVLRRRRAFAFGGCAPACV